QGGKRATRAGGCRAGKTNPPFASGSRPPCQGGKAMKSLAWVAGFAVLAALPFFLGSYHNDVYRKLLLWITLALGYNFLFGICGQVAFSHFAFYGIGAYSVVILLFQFNLPLPVAIVLGVVICAGIALVVAIPSTRLEGFYLALVTLALAQLFIVVLNEGGNV